jgi:hypothetical protein
MTNLEKATNYLLKHPGASVNNLAKRIGVSYSYAHKLKQKIIAEINNRLATPEQDAAMDALIATNQDNGGWQVTASTPTSTDVILEQRGNRYGKFSGQAEISQRLKGVVREFEAKRGCDLAPDQREALEMVMHKVARIINGDPNYHDSWADIAGYAKLVADRLETGKEV